MKNCFGLMKLLQSFYKLYEDFKNCFGLSTRVSVRISSQKTLSSYEKQDRSEKRNEIQCMFRKTAERKASETISKLGKLVTASKVVNMLKAQKKRNKKIFLLGNKKFKNNTMPKIFKIGNRCYVLFM